MKRRKVTYQPYRKSGATSLRSTSRTTKGVRKMGTPAERAYLARMLKRYRKVKRSRQWSAIPGVDHPSNVLPSAKGRRSIANQKRKDRALWRLTRRRK